MRDNLNPPETNQIQNRGEPHEVHLAGAGQFHMREFARAGEAGGE